jgi:mRNA interferase RelE/StbE
LPKKGMYNLKIAPGAERDIRKLQQRMSRLDFQRLSKALNELADEPHPQGVKKIKGAERAFRIRVGSYRMVYIVDDNENLVLILQVVKRTESTYRS